MVLPNRPSYTLKTFFFYNYYSICYISNKNPKPVLRANPSVFSTKQAAVCRPRSQVHRCSPTVVRAGVNLQPHQADSMKALPSGEETPGQHEDGGGVECLHSFTIRSFTNFTGTQLWSRHLVQSVCPGQTSLTSWSSRSSGDNRE